MLKNYAVNEVNKIGLLAVAIRSFKPSFNHTGFFYLTSQLSKKTRFCHLEGHLRLTDENAEDCPEYFWVESDLHKVHKKGVCALIKNIVFRNKNGLPYGFDSDGHSFSKDGLYNKSSNGEGLTCATFIMDVLSCLNFNMIDKYDWPSREEDEEWKKDIIEMLKKHASKGHVKALEGESLIYRFRPEEVAAAFSIGSKDWPAKYEDISPIASIIKSSIEA